MASRSFIQEFSPTTETISTYLHRMDLYFKANKVAADLQVATLLTHIGSETFQRLCDLVAPELPGNKTLSQLRDLLKAHFEPKKLRAAERYNFRLRKQGQEETVAEFDAALRRLAKDCVFTGDRLEEELQDQIILGIRDDQVRKQLLSEADLDYKRTLQIVQAAEQAIKTTERLSKRSLQVNYSSAKRGKSPPQTSPSNSKTVCHRCGGQHKGHECRFKEAHCNHCGNKGHIKRACRFLRANKKRPGKKSTLYLEEHSGNEEELLDYVGGSSRPPIQIDLSLNGSPTQMELDTGAARTLISEKTYQSLWKKPPKLKKSSIKLRTYAGESLKVLGSLLVTVRYQDQEIETSLLVVEGTGQSLLGRDWLSHIKLDWKSLTICSIKPVGTLTEVLESHGNVFRSELGQSRSIVAVIPVDASVTPIFCKARPVPYALRDKVDKELTRLQEADVIEPVQFSDWAAPIVSVLKPDGSLRICGDYKITINKAAKAESYPLPRAVDLFAKVSGGKTFSKLDIRSAYQQIPLQESSQECVTINTPKGLFRYKRLPFGVHSAPAIFQRAMEGLLRDIPSTVVYIDDILVTGSTEEEHLQNLEAVLSRLEEEGLTLKKEKCQFMMEEVEYLGHVISAEGLRPATSKARAILEAPTPKNVSQLRSFLGMVNYYGKFVDNLSTRLAPLHQLLQKDAHWKWETQQTKAFEEVRQLLAKVPVLGHYNPEKPLTLATDASPYGIGAVLSHSTPDGTEKPIAYASRSLNKVERRYSQLDKEALSVKFGVQRFHQYLFGREFAIVSDHKPLQYLLSQQKSTPTMASARLQRWALILSAYKYTIRYKPGDKMANADGLSRLPLPEAPKEASMPEELVLLLDTVRTTPITSKQVKQWTDRDPILSRVRTFVHKGWTETSEDALAPYRARKDELSILDNCVLWGNRLIIPEAGRKEVLEILHEGHPGITKSKQIARQVIWWPGVDNDIDQAVRLCQQCQQNQKNPDKAPLHVWEWPTVPWRRIHIDHLGPVEGRTIFVAIDAHSKWIEAAIVRSTTTKETVHCLRDMIARYGLPEMIVSDNGTAFTSDEFKQFVVGNGITHKTTAPYHPATNGLAERAVQVIKNGLRKHKGDFELRLQRTLFSYRTQPQSTTGVTPAELLMNRKLRTKLDLLHPDLSSKVAEKQWKQQEKHSTHADRKFEPGDKCYVRNYRPGDKWIAGKIVKCLGPRNFEVELLNGAMVKRHLDQIRTRAADISDSPLPLFAPNTLASSSSLSQPLRRSTRQRRQPNWYRPNV